MTTRVLTPQEGVRTALEVAIARRPDSGSVGLSEADALWPRRLRRVVRACLNYWGYPGLIETAELLITELATNALRHAHSRDIRVRVDLQPDHCRLEVKDGSPTRPELRLAGLDDERGRGLFLIEAMAGQWGVSDDGTTTWCAIPLKTSCTDRRLPLMSLPSADDPATCPDGTSASRPVLTAAQARFRWEASLEAAPSISRKTRSLVRTRLTVARWPGNIDAASRVCGMVTDNAVVHAKPLPGNVIGLRLVWPMDSDDLIIEVTDGLPEFAGFERLSTNPEVEGQPHGLWWVPHYRGRIAWRLTSANAGEPTGKVVQIVLPKDWGQ